MNALKFQKVLLNKKKRRIKNYTMQKTIVDSLPNFFSGTIIQKQYS